MTASDLRRRPSEFDGQPRPVAGAAGARPPSEPRPQRAAQRFERERVEELCDVVLEQERRLALRLLRLIWGDTAG